MRGLTPGLLSPHPLGETLPAMYLGDSFTQQLCGGLDELLAPVLATLDALPAYFDPATAPEDMLGWLASWLGLALDENQPEQRRRELLARGVWLLGRRGTVTGIREAVEAVFDQFPEVDDPGGAHWAVEPGSPLPGVAAGELVVRVRVADPAGFDVRRLDAVVAAVKPAHVRHRVEVLPAG